MRRDLFLEPGDHVIYEGIEYAINGEDDFARFPVTEVGPVTPIAPPVIDVSGLSPAPRTIALNVFQSPDDVSYAVTLSLRTGQAYVKESSAHGYGATFADALAGARAKWPAYVARVQAEQEQAALNAAIAATANEH